MAPRRTLQGPPTHPGPSSSPSGGTLLSFYFLGVLGLPACIFLEETLTKTYVTFCLLYRYLCSLLLYLEKLNKAKLFSSHYQPLVPSKNKYRADVLLLT